MYEIRLPKVLFLALIIAQHFHKKHFINTNDLADLANEFANNLVRLRKDKKDYKYLQDTNFGGLRGNFSTLLTLRGLVKRGSRIVAYYGIGKDDRIMNAILKGDIVLKSDDLTAHTNNERLKNLLETEAKLLTIRETQAHIKQRLEKGDLPLKRDSINFPKESVVTTPNGQYFLRVLVNNYINQGKKLIEYNLVNLWSGSKFKKKNIHALLVIPTETNAWDKIYTIKNEDLFIHKPIFLKVDIENLICTDKNGNIYPMHTLDEAIGVYSKQDENISQRLSYEWDIVKNQNCESEADEREVKEDEFSIFLEKFLNWGKSFSIDNKDVVDIKVVSSGGPDVRLTFSGGTGQPLELEHNWKNYLDHGHQTNHAFGNCWIFAEENWDAKKILNIYKDAKREHNNRIPDVFLCLENGVRKAYRADWDRDTFNEISLSFPNS
jgi:hypothetical protein